MEHYFIIEQKVLEPWHDRIDLLDAAIVGYIRKLNSHDSDVRKCMRHDLFRLNREWLLDELPLLRVGTRRMKDDTLSIRLHHLQEIGLLILKLEVDPHEHKFQLFGKLTQAYFNAEKVAKDASRKADPFQPAIPLSTRAGREGHNHLQDDRRASSETAHPSRESAGGGVAASASSGALAPPEQQGKKDTRPRCPACGKVLNYPDWPCCEHCSTPLPATGKTVVKGG